MLQRIFIAINLPENLKKRLEEFREKYDYLPVRWTKQNSLHLTVVFIGYVTNEQMLEACRAVRKVTAKCAPFFINFKKILLGPPDKPPRMIWLEGEVCSELIKLKNQLESTLLGVDSGLRRKERRNLAPHVTLARIKMEKWRSLYPSPQINENFLAQTAVNSIEIMESDLKRDGAEYTALESFPLGE